MIYKKVLGTILSKVDGDFVILKGTELFKVNEVGARIFELCNGVNSTSDITEKLSNYFEKPDTDIVSDVVEFTNILFELKMVKIMTEE